MLFWRRRRNSPAQAATVVGYETSEHESVPQASILGVGCGTPVKFADLQKGETVVDLGSGVVSMYFCQQTKSAIQVRLLELI